MIYINLKGGLGNQMFEYAFAYALSKKSNDKICLDLRGISNLTHNVYSLDYFNISRVEKTKSPNLSRYQTIIIKICNSVLYRTESKYGSIKRYNMELKMQKFLNKNGLYLCSDGYISMKPCSKKSKYADGYFQCDKYFDEYSDEIRKQFQVKEKILDKNKPVLKKIQLYLLLSRFFSPLKKIYSLYKI